jgi:hypothetical protein
LLNRKSSLGAFWQNDRVLDKISECFVVLFVVHEADDSVELLEVLARVGLLDFGEVNGRIIRTVGLLIIIQKILLLYH